MKSVQAVGTLVKIQTPFRNTRVNIIDVNSMKYFPCLGPIISDLCCASEVDVVTKPIKAHRKERQCDVCSNMFSDRRSREEHIRTMHPNTLHKCEYCLKEFLKESSLVQHTKSAHPYALPTAKEYL